MLTEEELNEKRADLVASLKEKGVKDENILAAINTIPRHQFVVEHLYDRAYEDIPLPIGNSQTISQPYTVAYMTALLNVHKHDKILEIGTGSGYQAAILASMGAKVFSLERILMLHQKAKGILLHMGLQRIKLFWRDGFDGLEEHAPFDRIIVTAGIPVVPEILKKQLKPDGGRLVIPVGSQDYQKMHRITRLSNDSYREEIFDAFKFVPFLAGVE
ncbi:MAG: protein-L-isoaspartate(D-aspartate) O-methyltransferase [Saprospiraceae bacterium]|nr:protein-L-isoaspartate(D-aspartate) O-methyltransferase [Saprospiraceae bacterium]